MRIERQGLSRLVEQFWLSNPSLLNCSKNCTSLTWLCMSILISNTLIDLHFRRLKLTLLKKSVGLTYGQTSRPRVVSCFMYERVQTKPIKCGFIWGLYWLWNAWFCTESFLQHNRFALILTILLKFVCFVNSCGEASCSSFFPSVMKVFGKWNWSV